MANKKTKPINEEVIEETVTPAEEIVEEPVVEETKYVMVTADKLNVRKGPSKDTEVLAIVSKNETLIVNDSKLVKGFYSVTTSTGIQGYVMKEYVKE